MIDLEKYKADMARAREAGITFEAIRDIMNAHADDGPDGESFGRMVERIRELTLQAAVRMVAEERAATAEWLRAVGNPRSRYYRMFTVCETAGEIERGVHRRKEKW